MSKHSPKSTQNRAKPGIKSGHRPIVREFRLGNIGNDDIFIEATDVDNHYTVALDGNLIYYIEQGGESDKIPRANIRQLVDRTVNQHVLVCALTNDYNISQPTFNPVRITATLEVRGQRYNLSAGSEGNSAPVGLWDLVIVLFET